LTVTAKRNGLNLEIDVAAGTGPAAVYYSAPAADIDALTLQGSSTAVNGRYVLKDETFVVDGALGLPSIRVLRGPYRDPVPLRGTAPVPAGGLTFDGTGSASTLKVAATVSTRGLTLRNVNTVEVDSGTLDVAADLSTPNLTLAGGTLQGAGNVT